MRRQKLAEAAFVSVLVVLVSFLVVAGLDRIVDTHATARLALLAAAVAFVALVVPRALRRWYWRHRDLRDVAQEISIKDPLVGDRLLGVFELSSDRDEFARSPELVRAAVAQGESQLGGRDLDHALPVSRHRFLARVLVVPAVAVLAFAVVLPAVFGNALERWLLPLGNVERFTFARLDGLEAQWVVPIQEERGVELTLADATRSRPAVATLRFGRRTVEATLEGDAYRFVVPPLASERSALLVVGDIRKTIQLQPRERPEVVAADATVSLPAYLELDASLERDVRGGALSVVDGSEVTFDLRFSRELARIDLVHGIEAPEDGPALRDPAVALRPDGDRVSTRSAPTTPADGRTATFEWVDTLGLEGHGPFTIGVRPRADEEPAVATSGVDAKLVLLRSTALRFDVLSTDDFGVRTCGLEWFKARSYRLEKRVSLGSKVLRATGPDAQRVEALATFRPADLDLPSGMIELCAWAVDSLPGRERAYSAPIRVRVMTAEEHMEWITSRFDRWVQRAVEVRDRELELLAENRELLALSNAELDEPGTRSRIEGQARAERANRARLSALVGEGAELLNQATRNPEIGSNTLDDWAEANAKLKEIADKRMDSVAKLLLDAAKAEASEPSVPSEPKESGSVAGTSRSSEGGAAPPAEDSDKPEMPPTPTVVDRESSIAGAAGDEEAPTEPPPSSAGAPPPLGLASTTLGAAPGQDPPPPADDEGEEPPSPTKEELAKAVAEQEALIEAFNEVAGDIQQVLANLENSTFVKRLKAASRKQSESAEVLDVAVVQGFGSVVATAIDDVAEAATLVADREKIEAKKLGHLYSDLDAYTDRLRSRGATTAPKFERLMDEWSDVRPVFLVEDLTTHAGRGRPSEARSSANFLSDTLDRWGEELVGPG